MQVNTKAIVLRTVKYGDSQVIVDMLTKRMGRVSFIWRIPKTSKARVRKQFFQPLNLLDIEFNFKQSARLQHVADARIAHPFTSIPFNPLKLPISMFIAEFLSYATREEQQNEPLFDYVEHGIEWLDGSTGGFSNFHLVFMTRLSRFLGFFPNLTGYHDGDTFDMREGVFSSTPPLHPDTLAPADAAKISTLTRMDFETMRLFAMSRQERNRCVDIIVRYYRLHSPNFPAMKSLSVLQELFA